MDLTCSQIMHAEQVLESQFYMGITGSRNMHDEQALKSQFNTDLSCSQNMHAEQALGITNIIYHLQPDHTC